MSIADALRTEQGVWQSTDGGFANEGTVLNRSRIVCGISEVFGVRKAVIRGMNQTIFGILMAQPQSLRSIHIVPAP